MLAVYLVSTIRIQVWNPLDHRRKDLGFHSACGDAPLPFAGAAEGWSQRLRAPPAPSPLVRGCCCFSSFSANSVQPLAGNRFAYPCGTTTDYSLRVQRGRAKRGGNWDGSRDFAHQFAFSLACLPLQHQTTITCNVTGYFSWPPTA